MHDNEPDPIEPALPTATEMQETSDGSSETATPPAVARNSVLRRIATGLRRPALAVTAASIVAAIAFFPATVAEASAQTVTITPNGYVPLASTVAAGDSIGFVNGDINPHQILFKTMTGITCTPSPLVLQPKATGSCTFKTPGTYAYSDPNINQSVFKGTITVTTAAPSVDLAISPGVAIYGSTEGLSGKTSNPKSAQSVKIFARMCSNSTASQVGTATTSTGGAFSFRHKTLKNTTYFVRVNSATSNSVLAGVAPMQQLKKLSRNHFLLRVSASSSFAGKFVTLQRYNVGRGLWVNVKRVNLSRNTGGSAPTVISAVKFTSTLSRVQKIRTILGSGEVGSCYLPGASNSINN